MNHVKEKLVQMSNDSVKHARYIYRNGIIVVHSNGELSVASNDEPHPDSGFQSQEEGEELVAVEVLQLVSSA